MSIQPPSDIILDVAQAADPTKSMAAAQKLMQVGAANASGETFSGVLGDVSSSVSPLVSLGSRLGSSGNFANAMLHNEPVDARTKAYKGLEALILQNLFETTLPHDSSLGDGMAGDVFRSMMAEQLGKQLGKTMDLGIAPKTPSMHVSASRSLFAEPLMDEPSLLSGDPETSEWGA